MTEAQIMSCPKPPPRPLDFGTSYSFPVAQALKDVRVLVLAGRPFEEVIIYHCDAFAAYGDLQDSVRKTSAMLYA